MVPINNGERAIVFSIERNEGLEPNRVHSLTKTCQLLWVHGAEVVAPGVHPLAQHLAYDQPIAQVDELFALAGIVGNVVQSLAHDE